MKQSVLRRIRRRSTKHERRTGRNCRVVSSQRLPVARMVTKFASCFDDGRRAALKRSQPHRSALAPLHLARRERELKASSLVRTRQVIRSTRARPKSGASFKLA